MKHKLGVIGVGFVGMPIAINLHQDGFDLIAYDQKESAVNKLRENGVAVAASPKELAEKSDIILDVLNDTKALRSVLTQKDGLLEGINSHKIIIDMTTSDPNDCVEVGTFLKQHDISYIDCPMAGGVAGAQTRQLVLMGGGDPEVFEKCRYILEHISKKIFYLGKLGSGHYMKLIHNQLSASTFLAACEAVLLGKGLGLDVKTMIDVFNMGNARSYATEVRFPQYILSGTYNGGGALETAHKDIALLMEKVEELHYDLPIAKAVHDYWSYAVSLHKGKDDYSTIFKVMEEKLNHSKGGV